MNVPPEPIRLEALLGRSWRLLRSYPAIVVPLILMLVLMVPFFAEFAYFIVTAQHDAEVEARAGWMFLGIVVAWLFLFLYGGIALLATFAMADALWVRGTTSIGEGFRVALARFWPAIGSYIGVIGLALAALILFLPTLGLSFLALLVFTMYILPAVVGGGRGGFAAIEESFRLVQRYFGASALALLVVIAIQYAISLLFTPLNFVALAVLGFPMTPSTTPQPPPTLHLPPIPELVVAGVLFFIAMACLYAYYGFYALMLCGLYRSLRDCSAAGQAAVGLPTEVPAGGAEG
ncbi:MAG: hypothetical protein ABSD03_14675 [Vulcanimicrobiaceae bacterium]|jgi:hypothetical protein